MNNSDKLQKILLLLPCLESYYLLAKHMKSDANTSEKYIKWIDYYIQKSYVEEVTRYRQGVEKLLITTRSKKQFSNKDLLIYQYSYQYEYEFWKQCTIYNI